MKDKRPRPVGVLTLADVSLADSLIAASLIKEGNDAAAYALQNKAVAETVRRMEQTMATLFRVRRVAQDAKRARHPTQAALRCVDKILRITEA